jgi:hypothetical protein
MLKNIAILIALIGTVAFGYYLFVLENQSVQTTNSAVVTSAEQQSRDFLQRLEELQQIELNTDVLNDPRFTDRVNYQRAVPTLPVGRDNPFLPAGSN